MHRLRRIVLGVFGATLLICGLGLAYVWFGWIQMPGDSFDGELPETAMISARGNRLAKHVGALAGDIGERNVFYPDQLNRAADYVEEQFKIIGYTVDRYGYTTPLSPEYRLELASYFIDEEAPAAVTTGPDEVEVFNLVVERPGSNPGFVIIGAHYDSVINVPGADDNASGVAALLELATMFSNVVPTYGLRFVAFPNEEPPWFRSEYMGSYQYAQQMSQQGEEVHAMLALDTMGFFTDMAYSQEYPKPVGVFYPSTGNFLAFVSDLDNRSATRRMVQTFRGGGTPLATVGGTLPSAIPGIDWSDHRSFWNFGYPGTMVTDTGLHRNPHYHEATDTPETLNYEALAIAVDGLALVIADLAGVENAGVE